MLVTDPSVQLQLHQGRACKACCPHPPPAACRHRRVLCAHPQPVEGMVWVCGIQEAEFDIVGVVSQDTLLKLNTCRGHAGHGQSAGRGAAAWRAMRPQLMRGQLVPLQAASASACIAKCAPLRATNCAVLSTIARMSGGGMITPMAFVCVASFLIASTSTVGLDAEALWAVPTATIAPASCCTGVSATMLGALARSTSAGAGPQACDYTADLVLC